MVAREQDLRHQTVAIALHGAAQRVQFERHATICGRDISERGQPRDLGRCIRYRRGGIFCGTEQGLFACAQNGIARELIHASQGRQRCIGRLRGPGCLRTSIESANRGRTGDCRPREG